jgi:glycopeptide antibiotics resistance protein
LAVELIQVWYPSRVPSLLDLIANSLGVVVGLFVYHFFGSAFLKLLSNLLVKTKSHDFLPFLITCLILYMCVVIFMIIKLQQASRLQNWDSTYPLLLGNEATGDRPWEGSLFEVHFADQSISESQATEIFSEADPSLVLEDSLIGSYRLSSRKRNHDIIEHLPDLIWYGTPPSLADDYGAKLAVGSWLITDGPVAQLTQAIQETSKFTIVMDIASARSEQYGPARILSISEDPEHRNLTIGQEGEDLVLRFRYPTNGKRAEKPIVIFQDIFVDQLTHKIIITYDAPELKLYVDERERLYTVSFIPELLAFHWLIGTPWWHLSVNSRMIYVYSIFFYGLVFIPAGILLGYLFYFSKIKILNTKVAMWTAILLLSAIVEASLARERGFNSLNYTIGFGTLSVATILWMRVIALRGHRLRI